jgi:thiol-disulfide isomerase/thioredoxin
MKQIVILFTLILSTSVFSQIDVSISGQIISHTAKEVVLSRREGKKIVPYLKAPIDKDGKFSIKGSVPERDYYVLAINKLENINLVIEGNDEIKVYTDEKNITEFSNIVGSTPSNNIHKFLIDFKIYNAELQKNQQAIKKNQGNRDSITAVMDQLRTNFNFKRDRFARENKNSPALIVILNLYDKEKEFKSYEKISKELINGFPNSPTTKRAQAELDHYKKKQEASLTTAIGKKAPEIDMPLENGTSLKLSDLKGKVVLLDFWASWCRPCRAENPNVVKLYNKYKDEGFTVYSVSMDSDKNKWLLAIEQDQLAWPTHVSDLKGWSSTGGRTYGVSSIPTTDLIDKNGKINNKNLRGSQLDRALEEIFGF